MTAEIEVQYGVHGSFETALWGHHAPNGSIRVKCVSFGRERIVDIRPRYMDAFLPGETVARSFPNLGAAIDAAKKAIRPFGG